MVLCYLAQFISCGRIYLPPVFTNFESWSKRWRLWKINGTRAINRPYSLHSVGCFNWAHKSEVNDVTPFQQLSKSWHFTIQQIQHGVHVCFFSHLFHFGSRKVDPTHVVTSEWRNCTRTLISSLCHSSCQGTLPNYFLKLSAIMTLSLGPPPPPLASWQK